MLSGTNNYSGGTNVNAGTLSAATTASLPGYNVLSQVSIAGGAALVVPTSSGTAGWSASQIESLLANTAWNSNTSVLGIDTTQGTLTIGSNITAALSLAKLGAGALVLTGSNASIAGATVEAGTLILTTPDAVADGSNLTVGRKRRVDPCGRGNTERDVGARTGSIRAIRRSRNRCRDRSVAEARSLAADGRRILIDVKAALFLLNEATSFAAAFARLR